MVTVEHKSLPQRRKKKKQKQKEKKEGNLNGSFWSVFCFFYCVLVGCSFSSFLFFFSFPSLFAPAKHSRLQKAEKRSEIPTHLPRMEHKKKETHVVVYLVQYEPEQLCISIFVLAMILVGFFSWLLIPPTPKQLEETQFWLHIDHAKRVTYPCNVTLSFTNQSSDEDILPTSADVNLTQSISSVGWVASNVSITIPNITQGYFSCKDFKTSSSFQDCAIQVENLNQGLKIEVNQLHTFYLSDDEVGTLFPILFLGDLVDVVSYTHVEGLCY